MNLGIAIVITTIRDRRTKRIFVIDLHLAVKSHGKATTFVFFLAYVPSNFN
jgi:hypothetical protein